MEAEERKFKNPFAPPPNLVQQFSEFFNEKDEEDMNLIASQQESQSRRIKACYVCKNQKTNHIVKIFANQDSSLAHDEIRQMVLNLAPRDHIEQVVFDPNLGIMKREIYFGIIDYVMTYNMKKRLDELLHAGRTSTAVRPAEY